MGMFKYEFYISKNVKYLIPATSKQLILNNPYNGCSINWILKYPSTKRVAHVKEQEWWHPFKHLTPVHFITQCMQ